MPGEQAEQLPEPAALLSPARHREQNVLPLKEYLPAGQGIDPAVVGQYDPVGQGKQQVLPPPQPTAPFGHGKAVVPNQFKNPDGTGLSQHWVKE